MQNNSFYGTRATVTKQTDPRIESVLQSLGHFIYYPNPGNLGDELIAEASMQIFDRLGLSYEMYDEDAKPRGEHVIVYGGGGGMIPDWNFLPVIESVIMAPGVTRCVILSHSVRDCESLLQKMDERYTIFCREQKSADYCRSCRTRAEVILTDDMGTLLNPAQVPMLSELLWLQPRPCLPVRIFATLFMPRFSRLRMLLRYYRKTHDRLIRHISSRTYKLKDGRRFAMMMRRDSEAVADNLPEFLQSLKNTDVSRYGGSDCRWRVFNQLGVRMFLDVTRNVDIIVTDRLHVSVAAALQGTNVIMIDNSYGKLSGVRKQSLSQFSHCHMCCSVQEVTQALAKLGITEAPEKLLTERPGLVQRISQQVGNLRRLLRLALQKKYIRNVCEQSTQGKCKPAGLVYSELRSIVKNDIYTPVDELVKLYFQYRLQYEGADTQMYVFPGEWNHYMTILCEQAEDTAKLMNRLREQGIRTADSPGTAAPQSVRLYTIMDYQGKSCHLTLPEGAESACELVKKAHNAVLPTVPGITWEVALTADGPAILSAHPHVDCSEIEQAGHPLRSALELLLKPAAAVRLAERT